MNNNQFVVESSTQSSSFNYLWKPLTVISAVAIGISVAVPTFIQFYSN